MENSVVGVVTPKSHLNLPEGGHGNSDTRCCRIARAATRVKQAFEDNMEEDAGLSRIEAMRANRCERKVIWLRRKQGHLAASEKV